MRLREVIRDVFGSALKLNGRALKRLQAFEYIALSRHAEKRIQQRGIKLEILVAVLLFGRSYPTKASPKWYGGIEDDTERTYSISLDQKSRRELAKALGSKYAQLADKSNIYLIAKHDPPILITIGHRKRRFHRR